MVGDGTCRACWTASPPWRAGRSSASGVGHGRQSRGAPGLAAGRQCAVGPARRGDCAARRRARAPELQLTTSAAYPMPPPSSPPCIRGRSGWCSASRGGRSRRWRRRCGRWRRRRSSRTRPCPPSHGGWPKAPARTPATASSCAPPPLELGVDVGDLDRGIRLGPDASATALAAALRKARGRYGADPADLSPAVTEDALRGLKFIEMLPPEMAAQALAERHADHAGAALVLGRAGMKDGQQGTERPIPARDM